MPVEFEGLFVVIDPPPLLLPPLLPPPHAEINAMVTVNAKKNIFLMINNYRNSRV